MTSITNEAGKDNAILQCCERFIKRFKIKHLLRKVNATKEKGFPAYSVFAFLLGLVFNGKNLYTTIATSGEKVPFGKDVVYRFLNKATINWNMFIFYLSVSIIKEVDVLTSTERKTVLLNFRIPRPVTYP